MENEDHTMVLMWNEREASRNTIDALVAALERARPWVAVGRDNGTRAQIDAALALARGGK